MVRGVQMVFVGDLYQLPPVVASSEKEIFSHRYATPYFFSASVFEEQTFDMEFVELGKSTARRMRILSPCSMPSGLDILHRIRFPRGL